MCQDGYFHTNALYVKFLNIFLASAVIPLLHIISLVVSLSVSVIVAEHDEPNKVDFLLIYIHSEFTQTLH